MLRRAKDKSGFMKRMFREYYGCEKAGIKHQSIKRKEDAE